MSTETATAEDVDDTQRDVSIVDVLSALIMLPAVLLHEITHAAIAWRWVVVDDPRDLVDRLVPPRLELHYPAGTPVIVVLIANLAPTIVGAAVAPIVVPWALGLELPLLVYVLGAWALYTVPSGDDVAVLQKTI